MLCEKTEFALEDFMPYRLNRAAEAVSLAFARIYKEKYGLSRPEWRAFAIVGQFGTVTATEISAKSTMDRTKVSRAVFSLEDQGWLKRSQDVKDRRVENLELTPQGRKKFETLTKLAQLFEEEIVAVLGRKNMSDLQNGLIAIEKEFLQE
ncbi:MAG: MarR family winged helix-turn-helix transcriptional regulator [Pseudomonadota bacterium]